MRQGLEEKMGVKRQGAGGRIMFCLPAVFLLIFLFSAASYSGQEKKASFADLDPLLQYRISEDQGRDNAAFHIRKEARVFKLDNTVLGLTCAIGQDGMEITKGAHRFGLGLSQARQGENSAVYARNMDKAHVQANRLTFSAKTKDTPVSEWYVNGPQGIQQGWTISRRIGNDDALILELAESGNLKMEIAEGGRAVALKDTEGNTILHYRGLYVYDARRRALPAHFEKADQSLRICIADKDALYPITVDPWTQAAQLSASVKAANDRLGNSVAVSSDGNTVVAGAWAADIVGTNEGAVYVYVKPGGGWGDATQTAKLTASDSATDDGLGFSVAISADGSTIVAGAYGDDTGRGAVYVYVKPGSGWANGTEDAKLTAPVRADFDNLGCSVAISSDGNLVIAGAYRENTGGLTDAGAVYVYVKPGSGWTGTDTYTAKLTASDQALDDRLGYSVAVSSDGSTVVAGAFGKDSYTGAAYVYAKPGGGWMGAITQNAKLTASDGVANDNLGYSVAVSSDGSTIVVGASGDDSGAGAAYVYVKPGGGWANATEGAKLTASDRAVGDAFGRAVTVNSDGSVVVAGAMNADPDSLSSAGAAYVYVKPGGGWVDATEGAKLTASVKAASDFFGCSVAVSLNASTIVVGANGADPGGISAGAAYVFSNPTLITLRSFTGLRSGNDVVLKWETGAEIANAGFHVWRSFAKAGPYAKITQTLLPAEGSPAQGANYTYTDRNRPERTWYYKLEDIDNRGKSTFHGPIAIAMTAPLEANITLLSPANGSALASAPLSFSWSGEGFAGYRLQFCASGNFTGRVITVPLLNWVKAEAYTPTRFVWNNILRLGKNGAPIYWRVVGKQGKTVVASGAFVLR